MSDIKNNPHYTNGVFLGRQVGKHIESTTYGNLETAIEVKTELVKDLKNEFGWDDDYKDVAETLGIIAALEQMKADEDAAAPVHVVTMDNVRDTAAEIGISLTEEQILQVVLKHAEAQIEEPDKPWDQIVESLIHEVKNEAT